MEIKSSQMGQTHGESSAISSQPWETGGLTSSWQVLNGTDCCSLSYEPPSTASEPLGAFQVIYELPPDEKMSAELKHSIARARAQMKKGGPYQRHNEIFGD